MLVRYNFRIDYVQLTNQVSKLHTKLQLKGQEYFELVKHIINLN